MKINLSVTILHCLIVIITTNATIDSRFVLLAFIFIFLQCIYIGHSKFYFNWDNYN